MYKNVHVIYLDGTTKSWEYVSDVYVENNVLHMSAGSSFAPMFKGIPLQNVREYSISETKS